MDLTKIAFTLRKHRFKHIRIELSDHFVYLKTSHYSPLSNTYYEIVAEVVDYPNEKKRYVLIYNVNDKSEMRYTDLSNANMLLSFDNIIKDLSKRESVIYEQ